MSRWTADDVPPQRGRVAVVTGANAGLGYEVARLLAARGAHVVLACRSTDRAASAAAAIRAQVTDADLEVVRLDLADLSSVRQFAAAVASDHRRLDLLINNAGLMALDESRTVDGFETQLGVNHLGHFALTAQLLPLLLRTPGSRVATMSSLGHRRGRLVLDDLMFERRGYDRWQAYFQSKLANLLFSAELQRRLAAAGAPTVAVAAHPGGSRTELGREGTSLSNRLALTLASVLVQSAATGALPLVRAATDSAVVGGEYYGPRFSLWGDPVMERPSRRARSDADARDLWSASEDFVGLSVDVGAPA